MQKKLFLAGALIGSAMPCAQVQAQSQNNVTIYGDVDQYIGYIHSDSGKSVTGVNDGAFLRSRIGVRGQEDLGDGYQAVFTLENGFGANNGAMADTTRLFDRQAWVGIASPAGTFRLGRQNTAIFFIGDAIDYTTRTTFGSVINTFGVPSRYDNDISYKSPRLAGLQLELHYAMTETAGQHLGQRGVYQLGLDYRYGPFRAGYAGLLAKPAAGAVYDDAVQYHNVYLNYNYGPGTVYAAVVRTNNVTSNANGNNATAILSNVSATGNTFAGTDPNVKRFYNIYQLSADYKITPQLRVGALYGVMVDTSGSNSGAKGGNLGTFYDLSKRTMLYGFANYMKNDSNAGFRFGGSGAPSANLAGADINGRTLVGLQAGILHRF